MISECEDVETRPSIIKILWDRIVAEYRSQFSSIYGGQGTKKLYLSDATKIDGASEIWVEVSLLDALITVRNPPVRISHKRLFDQRSALLDVVCEEITNAVFHMEVETVGEESVPVTKILVTNTLEEWQTFENLKQHIISAAVTRMHFVRFNLDFQIERIFTTLAQHGSLAENIEQMITHCALTFPFREV